MGKTAEPVRDSGLFKSISALRSTERQRRGDHAPAGRYDRRTHNTRAPAAGLARTPVKDTSRLADQIKRLTAAASALRARPPEIRKDRPAWLQKCARLEGQIAEMQRRLDRSIREASVVGAVADPWGRGDQRILVSIERRVDILEMERSHGRISEAAYQTGRQVQALLERQGKVKGADWSGGSRGDPGLSNELRKILVIANAREILDLEDRIRGRIGIVQMRLLRRIVGDRVSFADCAAHEGKGGDRGVRCVAERFRRALEDIAEVFGSIGKSRPAPDDAYKKAAVGLGERQAAAIAGGATRVRYQAEALEKRGAAAATRSGRDRARPMAEAEDIEARMGGI